MKKSQSIEIIDINTINTDKYTLIDANRNEDSNNIILIDNKNGEINEDIQLPMVSSNNIK